MATLCVSFRRRFGSWRRWRASSFVGRSAEEAPGAYKDSTAVVEAHLAGLSRKVATLEPLNCIKG